MQAAATWSQLELLAVGADLCPRCAAVVDHSLRICEDHEAAETLCESCHARSVVRVTSDCANCPDRAVGMFGNYLAATRPVRAFVAARGIDPLVGPATWGWDYEAEIRGTGPLDADFTYTVEGETLTVTVDGLDVVDARRE